MTDEQVAPSEQEDTPVPTEDPTTDEVTREPESETAPYEDESKTWEERYKHLQSFSSKQAEQLRQEAQEASAAQAFVSRLETGDPTAFEAIAEAYEVDPKKLLKELGLTKAEADALVDDDEDTPEFRDPRVDKILEQQQEAERVQIEQAMRAHIDELAKDAELELTAWQKEALFRDAFLAGQTKDGTEKVFKQFRDDLSAYEQAVIKKYRGSKKAAAPPAPKGSPGVPATGRMNEKDRLAFANEVAQRAIDSAAS